MQLLAYVLGADKGKKTEHVATPYPKQGSKGPASGVKGKESSIFLKTYWWNLITCHGLSCLTFLSIKSVEKFVYTRVWQEIWSV